MTKRKVTDIAASVRARLLAIAKKSNRPFQEVLQYFAMERFLYRMSRSPHADKFVLKGGLMLAVWQSPQSRPTKDIDFLAVMPNDVDFVARIIQEILEQPSETDGLIFELSSLKATVIKEDADYEGVRVTFLGYLQNARIHMQIDMGFGDVIVPDAIDIVYPTILDHESPRIWGYPRETTVAEKFEAMVKLGQLNSRIRDFFDVWMLSHQFNFDGVTLADAIKQTFFNRGTDIESTPIAFQPEFTADATKQAQWKGFCRKARIDFAPDSLEEVGYGLFDFLNPVAKSILKGDSFDKLWTASGSWQSTSE